MAARGGEASSQRRDLLRGLASLLAILVPFTPLVKEGGLARLPRATLLLLGLNIACHLVAWPAEKQGHRREVIAAYRLAEVESELERHFLGAAGNGPGTSSRLRGRNAFEEGFWKGFSEGRVVSRELPVWQEWNVARERWSQAQRSRPYFRWGRHPDNGNPLSFLTAAFLHVGAWHLFGNMLGLWIAGSALEDAWGPRLILLIYLLSAMLSHVPRLLLPGDEAVGSVGASGAVAGLFGAFLVRMASLRLRFVILPLLPTVVLPGWIAFLPWALFELRNALSGVVTGVDHWAHVGGFASGALIALALRRARADDFARQELAAIDRRAATRKRERLEAEAALRLGGHDVAGCTELLVEASRADPGAHQSLRTALQQLVQASRRGEAVSLGRDTLQALWGQGRREEYAEAFRILRDQALSAECTSLELLHAADALSDRRPREAGETLHALLVARPEDPLVKPALSRYADLLDRLGDAAGAKAVRQRLASMRRLRT